jgi:protein-S-isoprenylcysteine O-methyltransferase Ste14
MRILEHRIPPPIVAIVIGAAMWAVSRITPSLPIDGRLRFALPAVLAACGFSLAAMAMLAFRRVRTTISPVKVEQASSIVTMGVYGRTRNPMYLGLIFLLAGWTIYLAAPWAILGPVLFVLFTTRFQIVPEERVLTAKFGNEYTSYQARVRRWL